MLIQEAHFHFRFSWTRRSLGSKPCRIQNCSDHMNRARSFYLFLFDKTSFCFWIEQDVDVTDWRCLCRNVCFRTRKTDIENVTDVFHINHVITWSKSCTRSQQIENPEQKLSEETITLESKLRSKERCFI